MQTVLFANVKTDFRRHVTDTGGKIGHLQAFIRHFASAETFEQTAHPFVFLKQRNFFRLTKGKEKGIIFVGFCFHGAKIEKPVLSLSKFNLYKVF
jgi:hypothetical protein